MYEDIFNRSQPAPDCVTNDWTDKVITVDIINGDGVRDKTKPVEEMKREADSSFHFEIPPGAKLLKREKTGKKKDKRSGVILFVLEVLHPAKGK